MASLTTEIKVARLRQSINQSDIADHLGVSVGTYQKWESDPDSIPLGKVTSLVKFLDDEKLREQVQSTVGGQ